MLEKVEQALRQEALVEKGQMVAAALSGGRDSVCLLSALKELQPKFGYRLSAVHINHGLRPEAGEEESLCRSLCRRWQIPLTVYRVDVKERMQSSGEGVEEAARSLRYQAFERLRADRIALAHHQQDQAETLLLHLLRGSGLTGLCGMQKKRLPYIRPMLDVSRAEIDAYIAARGLPYAEDASNQDTAFRRNRIRHELLPLLQQAYNPEIVRALAQTATLLQKEEAYLESQTPPAPEGGLSITWVLSYPENIQRRILRKWLQQAGLRQDISQVHVQQLMDLMHGQTGKQVTLPKDLTVDKTYDILHICTRIPYAKTEPELPRFESELLTLSQASEQWKSHEPFSAARIPALEDEKWLSADGLREMPVWRFRRPGDYLMAAGGRKKLKDFWIDEKIPRRERERVPLLADGAHVLWVFGYRLSDGVKITENTQRVLHVRRI